MNWFWRLFKREPERRQTDDYDVDILVFIRSFALLIIRAIPN